MRTKTVSIFRNGNNRAIRLPKDFEGVNEFKLQSPFRALHDNLYSIIIFAPAA